MNYSDPTGLQGEPNPGGGGGDFTTFYSPTAFSDLFPLASPIDSLAEAQKHISQSPTKPIVSGQGISPAEQTSVNYDNGAMNGSIDIGRGIAAGG